MSEHYFTNLAQVLRDAGLYVVEVDGWRTRGRSTGGFAAGQPVCVMWHHSASGAGLSEEEAAHYMNHVASARPIANVSIDRNGAVWVLAAGATNTNGRGGAERFSRGVVSADRMNTHAFGMEISNDGVGEPYPQMQVDAAFKASNAMNAMVGNRPDDVCTHHDYAPTRKIDPAKGSAVRGPWKPRQINSSGTWNVDDLRAECARRAGAAAPTPAPEPWPPFNPSLCWFSLWPFNPSKPYLRVGARGDAVRYAQGVMRCAGNGWHDMPIDGSFGSVTAGHVRSYQGFFGLYVDGEIGPVTWRMLDSLA